MDEQVLHVAHVGKTQNEKKCRYRTRNGGAGTPGLATHGGGIALSVAAADNSGRRENMLKCIERECNSARPKVDWRMHRYYVELKKGIREELYP